MVVIGVDPRTHTHVASALGPATNVVLASLEITASLSGYRGFLRWAAGF
jgi:hypothetical protein